jgi:hypothetical protein
VFKSSFIEELKYASNVGTQKYAFNSGVVILCFANTYQETPGKFLDTVFESIMKKQAVAEDNVLKVAPLESFMAY